MQTLSRQVDAGVRGQEGALGRRHKHGSQPHSGVSQSMMLGVTGEGGRRRGTTLCSLQHARLEGIGGTGSSDQDRLVHRGGGQLLRSHVT